MLTLHVVRRRDHRARGWSTKNKVRSSAILDPESQIGVPTRDEAELKRGFGLLYVSIEPLIQIAAVDSLERHFFASFRSTHHVTSQSIRYPVL
jgi:hypothetical protein